MGFYERLTMEQVSKAYQLMTFLKRLRVIGHLEAHTESAQSLSRLELDDVYCLIDMQGRDYSIVKDGYSHERQSIDQIELLEQIFGRIETVRYRGTY